MYVIFSNKFILEFNFTEVLTDLDTLKKKLSLGRFLKLGLILTHTNLGTVGMLGSSISEMPWREHNGQSLKMKFGDL